MTKQEPQSGRSTPRNVRIDEDNEALSVTWYDDHESVYPFPFLRGACPCAVCRGTEKDAPLTEVVPRPGIFLLMYADQGNYALRFLWSDGHDTGIYLHDALRTMCQCAECLSRPGAMRSLSPNSPN